MSIYRFIIVAFLFAFSTLLVSCGGGNSNVSGPVKGADPDDGQPSKGGNPPTQPPSSGPGLDDTLATLITVNNLSGNPAASYPLVKPSDSPKAKLGEMLFFNKALSLDYKTACASCHHPRLGSGDDLSLGTGIGAENQDVLGLGRKQKFDKGPLADCGLPSGYCGPNEPRNAPPVINSALYEKAMFWDGRVYVLGEENGSKLISTPDSGKRADAQSGGNLLQSQSRFPIVSPDEMRGYHHPELHTSTDVREFLVARFRGIANPDVNYDPSNDPKMTPADLANWLRLFQDAYGAGNKKSLITFPHIQEAIADYEAGMIFVDTPWNDYIKGDKSAINTAAKKGAKLFFTPISQGGLGCGACHSGDHFTDEKFYNVGFPQFGHGKRTDRQDLGRFSVTQTPDSKYAFRTPSLLNVMQTGPWGHDGAFDNMRTLLRYHVRPIYYGNNFTASDIQGLDQFQNKDLPPNYQQAQSHTQKVLSAASFAGNKLPQKELTPDEVTHLVAFLNTLSDPALAAYRSDPSCNGLRPCPSAWVPQKNDSDTDSNTLFAVLPEYGQSPQSSGSGASSDNGDTTGNDGVNYDPISLSYTASTPLTDFPDAQNCTLNTSASNNGQLAFSEKASALGLGNAINGYDESSWLADHKLWVETLMQSGGLSVTYLNDDCWPDIIFSGGDKSGLLTFLNKGNAAGFKEENLLGQMVTNTVNLHRVSGILPIDLNGDYRRELVLGNTQPGQAIVLAWDANSGKYVLSGSLQMGRNTFSISAGDINGDGYPDLYFAHWGPGGLPGSAPALFVNQLSGNQLLAADSQWGVGTADGMTQTFNFTPAFADINGDGRQDLLVASDFLTSWMSHNNGQKFVNDDPNHDTLIDKNGMGQAVADFDNDGKLDWFVSSVFDPDRDQRPGNPNWGKIGNRYYHDVGTQGQNEPLAFLDVTAGAGGANAHWGWGVCAADFNNDGWLDLFVENGFGYIPPGFTTEEGQALEQMYSQMTNGLASTKPVLFVNNGNGTFYKAQGLGFKPSNGRGVVCFDYDHDGDVDIGVNNNSGKILFYVNSLGHANGHHFLNVRLEGDTPNTEALGAIVKVTADLDGSGNPVTQMREVNANSHFVSHDTTDLHFGLADAEKVDVSITWPDGTISDYQDVAKNQFVIYKQGN